jgi:hypothetical protein
MLQEALYERPTKARLIEDPDFREFLEEWFPSNHLNLYLSETLTSRLARLAKAFVASKIEDPDQELFLEIFQSEMDRISKDAQYSGLGLRLAENGVEGNLQIRTFRSWLSSLLSLRWMKKVEEWKSGN